VTAERTCDLAPFVSPVVAQVGSLEQAGSALEILTQSLENFLARFQAAVCADLTEIVEECCGGGGATSFLDLTDTPDSYAGAANYAVAVNGAQTGLEFIPFPTIPPAPTYFLTPRLISMWPPSVATGAFGPAPTAAGGAQIQLPLNPTNALTANYRQRFSAAAAANSVAGVRQSTFACIVGSASPMGGFRLRWRFGVETYTSGARLFVGVIGSVAAIAGATDPSALTNIIAMAVDDTDTNWHIMHNDAAGTASRIDLGAGFAVNTTSLLELTIEVEPSAGTFDYTVRDLSLGTSTSGTATGDMPAGGQPLSPQMHVSSAATGAVQAIAHIFMSLEVGPGE
jgi:hypothetical protein